MASLRLKFSPSAAEGREGTLYFQIIHRRVTRTVNTGYRLTADEWDGRSASIRLRTDGLRGAALRLTAAKVKQDARRLADIITEKERSGVEYSADDIVALIRRLEADPGEYSRLLREQQQNLTRLFFHLPLKSLENCLKDKRRQNRPARHNLLSRLLDHLTFIG